MQDNTTTPTADEAFGAPTVDEAFPIQDEGKFSGGFADYFFSKTKGGRVMSAFGQGAEQAWGEGKVNTAADISRIVKNSDWLNSIAENNKTLSKGFNEYFIRPYAHVFDQGVNTVRGIFGGMQGATSQFGKELETTGESLIDSDVSQNPLSVSKVLGGVLGAAGEVIGHTAGAPMDTSNPENQAFGAFFPIEGAFVQRASRGRASGQIGEGEAGFFNTREPTPEHIQERVSAAKESGIPVPEIAPPEIDINFVAKKIDPDTFSELEKLKDAQENFRLTREYLEAQVKSPDDATFIYKDQVRVEQALQEVNKTLAGLDVNLRDLIPKAATARERAQGLLDSDTEYGNMFRSYIQSEMLENAMKMDDLQGSIESAVARADEILPSAEEQVKIRAQREKAIKPSEEGGAPIKPEITKTQKEVEVAEVRADGSIQQATSGEGSLLTSVEGTGEVKARGLSKNIEALAVERKLVDDLSDLPEYSTVSMKDQATKAVDLLEKDSQQAVDVALGRIEPPEGVYPEAVLIAVERKALLEGNVDLIRQLASQSNLSKAATTMGQRIRILGERDKTSPVAILKDIEESRAQNVPKAEVNKVKEELYTYIKEVPYDESAWTKWLNTIECK